MKNIKMRLAVLLSVMMILPSIVTILPVASMRVSAATTYVYMNWGAVSNTQVEQGQEFYIGDFVNVYVYGGKSWNGTASMTSVSYSSSKPSVGSVTKKGYFTAKKPGKTKITVKYKGKKVEGEIEVVEAGTFPETTAISGLRECAGKLSVKIPSKITLKNAYSLYKLAADVKAYVNKHSKAINVDGYTVQKSEYSDYYYPTSSLVVPQAGRYKTFMATLKNKFGYKNNPTSTRSAKVLRIQSASAKTNKITVKLKKKVDATQIMAARICNEDVGNELLTGNNKAYFKVPIIDAKSKIYTVYYGIAEINKGSAIMKIKSFEQYVSKKGKYVKAKLKKGRTYIIDS